MRRHLLSLVVFTFFLSCSKLPIKQTRTVIREVDNKATVVFFRPPYRFAKWGVVDVLQQQNNGDESTSSYTKLCRLDNGTYCVVTLNPGKISITSHMKNNVSSYNLEKGVVYYIGYTYYNDHVNGLENNQYKKEVWNKILTTHNLNEVFNSKEAAGE